MRCACNVIINIHICIYNIISIQLVVKSDYVNMDNVLDH